MARKDIPSGCRVVIEPRVYTNERALYLIQYGAEAHARLVEELRSRAETIIEQAKRHVDDIGSIEVEVETESVCEHCGYGWTEASDTYNGGCCEADEANNPEPQP